MGETSSTGHPKRVWRIFFQELFDIYLKIIAKVKF